MARQALENTFELICYPRSPIISITTSCWLQSHPNLQHESRPTIWLCFRPFSCSPDPLPQPKPMLKCYALCTLVPKAVYTPPKPTQVRRK